MDLNRRVERQALTLKVSETGDPARILQEALSTSNVSGTLVLP
ncbi:MAG: hypothetical protein ACI9MC_000216 [Kiritimatiellia bacterium]|jgi:hypothetical protein